MTIRIDNDKPMEYINADDEEEACWRGGDVGSGVHGAARDYPN
jgi:hypothetical protein